MPAQQQPHQLDTQRVCVTCGAHIGPSRARWWALTCPGVPWYSWEAMPDYLATKTTLAREGLRLAKDQPPAGYYIAWRRETYVMLYDRRRCVPKRAARSERERHARVEAGKRLLALRTCARCGAVASSARRLLVESDAPGARRLCPDCAAFVDLTRAARDLLTRAEGERRVCILDTETTGLGVDDEPIEVAIVEAVTGEVLLETRVRPMVAISDGARAVHGLSASDLADAPPLAEVWARMRAVLTGALVIAYNADFDQRMLAQGALRYGLERLACHWWCLMEACVVLDGAENERWLPLWAVCERLGVPGPAHGALSDALATRGVLVALGGEA